MPPRVMTTLVYVSDRKNEYKTNKQEKLKYRYLRSSKQVGNFSNDIDQQQMRPRRIRKWNGLATYLCP